MTSTRALPEDLIRDLVQCVQAARDGADHTSLFAIQCDLVLARAASEVDGILKPRTQVPPTISEWSTEPVYAIQGDWESR